MNVNKEQQTPLNRQDPSKTLGGVQKVKFKPKVPQKPAETENESIPSSTSYIRSSDTIPKNRSFVDRNKDKDNWKHSNRHNEGRGRGAGGGGRFVMPTGTTFFEGGAISTSSNSTTSLGLHIGAADTDINANLVKDENIKNESELESLSLGGYIPKSSTPEEFSDLCNEGDEWPPPDYDPLAPVSLPFGITSPMKQMLMDNQPILASPKDKTALELEEQTSMFLIQLPSALRLLDIKNVQKNFDGDIETVEEETKSALRLPRGKLGKIQMMKSGRVYLIQESTSKRFEITAGLNPSFAQHVAALSMTSSDPNNKGNTSNTSSSSSSALSTTTGTKKVTSTGEMEAGGGAPQGSLHVLGSITRKLVVVPNFED